MKFEDVFIPLVTFSALFVGYWFIWIEKEFNLIKKIGATIGLTALIVLYFGMCYLIGGTR